MRVPSGGPATINGILYQMLWCLLEAASLRFQSPLISVPATEDFGRVTLVLEPSRGGDASLLQADVQRVVQLKARTTRRRWALREFVEDVLPDLYRAVELNHPQKFEFITEGRLGDWDEAKDFFTRLANLPSPATGQSVASMLNAERFIHYRGSLLNSHLRGIIATSERELFEQIVSHLRDKHANIRSDAQEASEHKVLWLLSRLDYHFGLAQEQLRSKLIDRLRALVDNPDDVIMTLRSLTTALQERATSGDAHIDADMFFAEHGLRGIPLGRRQWPRLVEIGAEQTTLDLNRRFRYDTSRDVRPGGADLLAVTPVDLWRRRVSGADCLTLTGESGQGKTWRLCALANALAASDAPVALVKAGSNASQLAQDVAHRFWSVLCHRVRPLRLDEIGRHLRETGAVPLGMTWLYVLVDGVRTSQEALSLYQEIGTVDGVRLAFTTSEQVAERFIGIPAAPSVVELPVGDFTEDELRRYVAGGDAVRWHAIRDEQLRRVLHRPLLAWIYLTLAGEVGWDARNEYGLYDGYLRQHILGRLEDTGIVMASEPLRLAGLSLWDGEAYPWSRRQMTAFGFTNDLLAPLLESGFFIRDSTNHFAIWHDRLKEWGVGRALAETLTDSERAVSEVSERFRDILYEDPWHRPTDEEEGQKMPFVPMDTIWHLAQQMDTQPVAAAALDSLLRVLDETRHLAYEWLYEQKLPSIGSAIAPAIFRRLLEAIGDSQNRHKCNAMKRCLASLDVDAVAPDAIRLLAYPNEDIRRAAAFILAYKPAADALPILWRRYVALKQECVAWDATQRAKANTPNQQRSFAKDVNPHWEESEFWKALKVCVPLNPEWLMARIEMLPVAEESADASRPDALIWLLTYIDDDGKRWRASKESLRPRTEADQGEGSGSCEAAFAGAAYVWRDFDETAWLRERVGSSDWHLIGPKCLQALSRIAPDTAVDTLPNLDPEHLVSTRRWAFRYVLARRPDATRDALTSLIVGDKARRWGYAQAFAQTPETLTEASLECLLDDLYDATSREDADVSSLWRSLQCIERISDLPSLRILWRRGDEGWDEPLARLVVQSEEKLGYSQNPMLETAVIVLKKCGGRGLTRVINHWLSAEEPAASLYGVPIAHLHPDAETIRLLEDLSKQHDPRVVGTNRRFAHSAQEALGRIAAWSPFINSVVVWGKDSNRNTVNARVGNSPLSDSDMAPAFTALEADPKCPGAIHALGVGQRTDWMPHIVDVLNDEGFDVDNDITNACQWALAVMPNLSQEAVDALARRLPHTHGDWLIRPPLMRNGSPGALEILMLYLRTGLYQFRGGQYGSTNLHEVANTARFLLCQPSVESEAVSLCRARFSAEESLDSAAQDFVTDIAPLALTYPAARAALDCRPAQDFLNLTAFSSHASHGEKAQSILGLAAYLPEEAYAAAVRALWDDTGDRAYMPDLLLDIDPVRAVDDLFTFLISPQAKLRVHRHVCLALAERAKETDEANKLSIRTYIIEKTHSCVAQERRAACRVLGFMSPEQGIVTAIRDSMEDNDVHVFEAACEAWRQLEYTRCVEELVAAFLTDDNVSRRWGLIEATLETGDLGEPYRPLPHWLQKIEEYLSPMEWDWVEEDLDKRRKKREQELKWEEEHET